MTPYYQDDAVTIYHGDCRAILPGLSLPPDVCVVTDPPYGIGWDTDYSGRGMGVLCASTSFPAVSGDTIRFDPQFWLNVLGKNAKFVLFGANHYADLLPASAGWIVWDKTGGGRNVTDLSDGEMAWTNLTGGVRIWSHLWKGMLKDSEREDRRVHPTQKPEALFRWLISKWATSEALIFDPYAGSGPTLRAAKDLSHRAIGIEIEEKYCEIAAKRCAQEVLAL